MRRMHFMLITAQPIARAQQKMVGKNALLGLRKWALLNTL
jgi:hypothetical protein